MFLTPYSYDHKAKRCYEHPKGDTKTVPNQSFTINEIITRFTGGVMPNINRKVSYDQEDLRNEDWDQFDVTRRPDYDLADAISDLNLLKQRFDERRNMELDETPETPDKQPDNKKPASPDVI